MKTRQELLMYGEQLMLAFCLKNRLNPPEIKVWYTDPEFDTCAYYRDDLISIWPNECARIGVSARQWSYPGYVIDRTPYGVLQHELAHHLDDAAGARGGTLAHKWRQMTNDERMTEYCPNDNEWFAEIFRVFVTNPDLLRLLRPKMFALLIDKWPERGEVRTWEEVLCGAPERWIMATRNKILKAQKPKSQRSLFA